MIGFQLITSVSSGVVRYAAKSHTVQITRQAHYIARIQPWRNTAHSLVRLGHAETVSSKRANPSVSLKCRLAPWMLARETLSRHASGGHFNRSSGISPSGVVRLHLSALHPTLNSIAKCFGNNLITRDNPLQPP